MHQLDPQETFPIVYVLSDPSDTGTYYVRAVLRNSVTGAIVRVAGLDYVNLTNLGSRRFSKTIQAPNDASGLGTYIDITVSVYTDSGYTTKSDVYQEENTKYRIQQRWSPAMGNGGGYGTAGGSNASIDYKKLAEVVVEAFNSLPTTELPEVDLRGLYAQGDTLRELIKAIKMPEMKDVDLMPHTNMIISAMTTMMRELHLALPKLDLQPALDAIGAIDIPEGEDYKPHFDKLHAALKELGPKLEQFNKYAGFSKTIGGLLKEYGGEPSQAPTEKKAVAVDPRLAGLFKGTKIFTP